MSIAQYKKRKRMFNILSNTITCNSFHLSQLISVVSMPYFMLIFCFIFSFLFMIFTIHNFVLASRSQQVRAINKGIYYIQKLAVCYKGCTFFTREEIDYLAPVCCLATVMIRDEVPESKSFSGSRV